jgi:hypothetical protein
MKPLFCGKFLQRKLIDLFILIDSITFLTCKYLTLTTYWNIQHLQQKGADT